MSMFNRRSEKHEEDEEVEVTEEKNIIPNQVHELGQTSDLVTERNNRQNINQHMIDWKSSIPNFASNT